MYRVIVCGRHLASGTTAKKTSYKVETIPVEQPVRIALLSDIHLGYVNGVRELERIVQRVNEEQPDVVFIY